MKKNFIIILLGAAILVSCTNPDERTKVVKNSYSVSITAEGANSSNASPQTRVEDVDGTHHWSVGDKVGLYVFREGNLGGIVANLNEDYNGQDLLSGFFSYIISPDFFEAVIENIGMTGLHEESTPSANFEGTLTLEDISQFDPSSVYDYASYYPYIESNDRLALFLSLYALERETTVRSNTFPGHTVRLFGTMYGYMPPITWLDEGGEQHWSERMSFKYTHILSYIRLHLTANTANKRVNSITISSIPQPPNPEELLSIEYATNSDGTITLTNAYNNMIINIEDGMDVGDYIYIPLTPYGGARRILLQQPGDYGYLQFDFTFEDGTTTFRRIYAGLAESGKVIPLNLEL